MNEEQFQRFLKSNEEATRKAIEKFVNGDIREMRIALADHVKNDEAFQKRAEPMLQVFEVNKIVSAKFKSETGTIVFYAKSALTVGALVAMIWGVIKFIIAK